ncbi:MAG: ABC transporter ATP-binding protein [Acidimicrobiia bacterium]|nr:ABC transporter ATP-binding protein [Acidimicrobiia bacterium]MDH4305883.1 ABC transporter ATP-binding protein [Acidimicrobiia bacterium]MDH5293349.1 ABC transporter ATP-binding protein [Acidimicrobiia bacterium]
MAEIKVKNLHKEFGVGDDRVVALENVNLDIEGHVFVSIVGPSGCGKSTLLNILSGIETASSGTVDITQDSHDANPGYVFQAARLLPWRSVMENLMFVQKERDDEARARCQRYLDMVQLGDKGDKFPGELSGGMQQRVGIARAFSIEPDVLFMDEPFSHLDAITARSLRRELHEMWKQTKKTVLFVTHDVGEAVELSNRILVFAKGGKLEDDITVDLPFPRDPSDDAVAVAKAQVLRKFEELDLLAT